MNKKQITVFILVLFIAAGCSSGSRFSKEVLLSNQRVFSNNKSISTLIPNGWTLYNDNLNEAILLWFVNNNFNSSISITKLNSQVNDLSLAAEIVKASKKQNDDYKTFSKTNEITIDGNKSNYFLMEGKSLQYVFLFKTEKGFYELTALSNKLNENFKEELFHISKELIGSVN